MSGIRLIDLETVAAMNRSIEAIADAFRRGMHDFGDRLKLGIAAEAERRRQERNDELDWLGDWHGKVTR